MKSAAMIGGLLFTSGLFAQSGTTNPTKPAAASARAAKTSTAPVAMRSTTSSKAVAWAALDVERMKRELGLKPEQLTKLNDINARFEKEHQALEQDATKAGAEPMSGRVASLEQRRTREVNAVLDPQQLKKWDAAQDGSHKAAAAPATHAAAPAAKGTK